MLILSRRKDESIMIGDDVEIMIVDIRGDKVRLGITAPKSISVHRKEVYEAIQQEKQREMMASCELAEADLAERKKQEKKQQDEQQKKADEQKIQLDEKQPNEKT